VSFHARCPLLVGAMWDTDGRLETVESGNRAGSDFTGPVRVARSNTADGTELFARITVLLRRRLQCWCHSHYPQHLVPTDHPLTDGVARWMPTCPVALPPRHRHEHARTALSTAGHLLPKCPVQGSHTHPLSCGNTFYP